jgi:carbon storage regulator CsrA
MLVLSRKSNESIVIGDQIVIEILEISNNKIRIGIAAPADVRVVRGELAPKERPLHRLRRSNPGTPSGSGNANLRTVADEARQRLRQLRQPAVQDRVRDKFPQDKFPREQMNFDIAEAEPVAQEVAESALPYRLGNLEPNPRPRTATKVTPEDRLTQQEVYWQVEALNQYRSEWVAESQPWYEASVATV